MVDSAIILNRLVNIDCMHRRIVDVGLCCTTDDLANKMAADAIVAITVVIADIVNIDHDLVAAVDTRIVNMHLNFTGSMKIGVVCKRIKVLKVERFDLELCLTDINGFIKIPLLVLLRLLELHLGSSRVRIEHKIVSRLLRNLTWLLRLCLMIQKLLLLEILLMLLLLCKVQQLLLLLHQSLLVLVNHP